MTDARPMAAELGSDQDHRVHASSLRPRLIRFALALSALAISACNCDDKLATLQGLLDAEPDPLVFGDVPVGGQKTLALTLRNSGTFALNISSFTATGPFIAPSQTSSIAAGDEIQVQIGFRPPEVGPFTGTLSIQTDVPDTAPLEVGLSGTGIEAAVLVEPLIVDFGEVLWTTATQPETKSVTISNPGTDNFELTAIELSDDGAGAFTVDPSTAIGTFEPGDSASFEVSYMPNAMGSVSGRITLRTTAPEAAEIEVTLLAKAVGPQLEVCAQIAGGQELCTQDGELPGLDWGWIERQSTVTGTIRVINAGDRDMTVQGQVNGPKDEYSFSPDVDAFGQFVLEPGRDQTFSVSYTPIDYAFDALIVGFGSNSATRRSQTVRVEAQISRPIINIVPQGVTFSLSGGVTMGESTVRIYNCGQTDLVLQSNLVINQLSGAAGAFSLSNAPTAGTAMTGQGTDCFNNPPGATFTVVFQPPANDLYSAEVPVTSNDPINPTVVVDVTATKN